MKIYFIYNGCGQFTKYCERIKKFKETGDLNYIYKDEIDCSLSVVWPMIYYILIVKI